MGVSRPLVSRIERGYPGTAIGRVFEAAALVGLPLFGSAPQALADHRVRVAYEPVHFRVGTAAGPGLVLRTVLLPPRQSLSASAAGSRRRIRYARQSFLASPARPGDRPGTRWIPPAAQTSHPSGRIGPRSSSEPLAHGRVSVWQIASVPCWRRRARALRGAGRSAAGHRPCRGRDGAVNACRVQRR